MRAQDRVEGEGEGEAGQNYDQKKRIRSTLLKLWEFAGIPPTG